MVDVIAVPLRPQLLLKLFFSPGRSYCRTHDCLLRVPIHLSNRALKRREILKLDESCISNPKFGNFELDLAVDVQFKISDFGFEMQDSSNFKISSFRA